MAEVKKNGVGRFFEWLYEKLVKIDDTPQKIALGFGLGVFAGNFPGTGPLASLFCAFLFRANRAAALLGSFITNTWLTILTFILSVKAGSAILGLKWQDVEQDWNTFIKTFDWSILFKVSVLKVILPIFIGYVIISFFAGLLVYLIVLIVITRTRRKSLK